MNGLPLLSQPFRVFFPLAALTAASSVALWVAGLLALLPLPAHAPLWHAHEMLFGFALAIIAGFSLTAVINWTGIRAASPRELCALAAIWLLARVLALVPAAARVGGSAPADVLFLCGLALLMTRTLWRSRNRRNYLFIPLLWGLAALDTTYHLQLWASDLMAAQQLLWAAVYGVAFLMVFMGGRVIPFFTSRRCSVELRQWPWLNWTSTLSALLAGVLLSLQPQTSLAALVAAVAGGSSLLRVLLWRPWRTWRIPLLWILHLGYVWLGVAYLLAAWVHSGGQASLTLPIHALMVGALGCLGLGMMARVALGHSGRALEVGPPMILAFVLVLLAGVCRVAYEWAPLLPKPYWLVLAASGWCAAFLLYAAIYLPIVLKPRAP